MVECTHFFNQQTFTVLSGNTCSEKHNNFSIYKYPVKRYAQNAITLHPLSPKSTTFALLHVFSRETTRFPNNRIQLIAEFSEVSCPKSQKISTNPCHMSLDPSHPFLYIVPPHSMTVFFIRGSIQCHRIPTRVVPKIAN